MAVRIRLKRLGKIRQPYYRIVVADSRNRRDGRVIEEIGKYHPKQNPSFIEVKSDRAQYWLGVGAQPSEPVLAILKLTGDWQQYKGLPAPEHGVQVAEPKPDKKTVFEAIAKAAVLEAPAEPTKKAKAKQAEPKAAQAEPEAVAAGDEDAPAEAAAEKE